MKTKKDNFLLLILCFGFFSTISSYGQLSVDVGKDTTYCPGIGKMMLGDNAIIKNGVEPYSIKWECNVPKGLYSYFTASDLLSDTTAISPFFKYTPTNKWIKFTIHVTDRNNNYTKDSIRVRFSEFVYSTGYVGIEINRGDSILFEYSTVGGGSEPLQFHWQPKTGLSNPDDLITWCKPDHTTMYDIIATDSCGCVSAPNTVYYVKVLTTGFNELKEDRYNILQINQKGTKVYFNNPLKLKARVTVYTINGAICRYFDISNDHLEIANQIKYKGVYVIRISVGELTESIKFIKL